MMRRRQFIAASAKLALGSSAALLLNGTLSNGALADTGPFDHRQVRTLTAIARALFPYPDVKDEIYAGIVNVLGELPGESQDDIVSGLERLDAATDDDWLAASVDAKLAALETAQQELFFATIHDAAINVVYRHPDVWKRVGYEGSSIEIGGYLTRGFDDIDWLP